MLELYAQAIEKMQDPAINISPQTHSWTFQAYIHGVPANPFHPVESSGLRHGTQELSARIDLIYGQPAKGTPQADWKAAPKARGYTGSFSNLERLLAKWRCLTRHLARLAPAGAAVRSTDPATGRLSNLRIHTTEFSQLNAHPARNERILTINCSATLGGS